ncbi:MAG: hypothetical protein K6C97_08830 [Treponema sp.]|nr:hypothetical protein [Treponema sp.]
MKKYHVILFSAFVFLLAQSGCNWQIPEKVSVKTNAEYNFAVGEFSKDFSEDFDKEQLFSSVSSAINNARIYDYYPGQTGDVQQFLLKIPLMEIPVDFSSYFDSSSLASQIEGLSFSRDVTIPQIAITKNHTVDSSTVSAAINASFTFGGTTSGGDITFAMDFTSVTYSSGSLVITCSGIEDDSIVTITSNGSSKHGTFSNGSASIDINNFTINKSGTSISFTSSQVLPFYGTIASSSIISSASGLTAQSPIPVSVSTTIDMSSYSSVFQSCTVDSGSLTTKMKLPSGWSNIDVAYGISASGGVSFTEASASGTERTIDLSGKTITPESTSVTCVLSLSMNNATFNSSSITLEISSQIESFETISIVLSNLTTTLSASENFNSAIYNTVKSITLGSCGLRGTYTNTFPSGNNIDFIASSNFLGLSETTKTLSSATESGSLELLTDSTERTVTIKENATAANEFSAWDFSAAIQLPGYSSSNPSRIQISGVSSGATYTVGLTLTPVINWSSIVINTSSFSSLIGNNNLGINLSTLLDQFDDNLNVDLADKILVDSLPLYLYCTKPEINEGSDDPFENVAFSGTVRMFYGSDGSPTREDTIVNVLGNAASSQTANLTFKNPPSLEFDTTGSIVTTDISSSQASVSTDLKNLVNLRASGTLYVDYNLSFSNGSSSSDITITPSMLTATNSASSVGVIAYIVLPLKLKTSEAIDIDIFQMMGQTMNSDILGRSSASDFSSIEQYIRAIRSVSLTYDPSKMIFDSDPDITLNVKFANTSIDEDYSLGGDTVALNASQINELLNVYPLIPTVTVKIANQTELSISREFAIAMGVNLKIVTDGTVTLFGGQ